MRKTGVALIAVIMLGPACMMKTVFYEVNPKYESHYFGKETIAVCPFSGNWKIEGNDTIFNRVPDFYPYAEFVAREIGRKRKCLTVVQPEFVAQKVPEIESLLFKHKQVHQKFTENDSAVFSTLSTTLNADYLVFFESMFFKNEQPAGYDTAASMNTTILVFQVWDLKNRQFMYRGESKGSGEGSKGGRVGMDARSGKRCIQNTAFELVKALPLCK